MTASSGAISKLDPGPHFLELCLQALNDAYKGSGTEVFSKAVEWSGRHSGSTHCKDDFISSSGARNTFVETVSFGLVGERRAVSESVIPTEVRQFVGKYIRSLDELEVLLLVSALPDREWSAEDVNNVVRTSPAAVAERLEKFNKLGMLSRIGDPPVYRFQPRTEELATAISSLSGAYKMSRHRIIELIYSGESSASLKGFSDAFRLKKEE